MKGSRSFKHIELGVMVSFLIHILFAGNAFGRIPCGGQTVNIGETMHEVTAKCGEAALKEERTVTVSEINTEITGTIITSTTTTTSMTIDEWTYDFGPEEQVQSYRFENGKLKEVISKGLGPVHDFSIDICRNGEALVVGDSTVDTYLKCGEPIAKENRKNKVIENEYGVMKRRTTVPVVEWTYRYGPGAPGYTITFENGVAVNIRTREFGK
jgi:hypothetical protein